MARLLVELVGGPTSNWTTQVRDVWAYAQPEAHQAGADRAQGWKLHVSATPGSAEEVLRRVAWVLVPAGCAFKVARDLVVVDQLTSARSPRESAGKVITVYPADDAQAVELAGQLDRATRGLPGQRVLSDRVFAPGSLVHYRFGGFNGARALSHDGEVVGMLRAPDGSLEPDVREPAFRPPAWAASPFPAAPEQPASGQEPAAAAVGPRRVLIGGRFAVHEAIRHANRGGVFRAVGVDPETGTPDPARRVIVKQARPHVGAGRDGFDVTARLRHEAEMLRFLGGRAGTPRMLEMIDQGGDLFLVEEELPGLPLRTWVGAELHEGVLVREHAATAATLRGVVAVLRQAHDAGLVVRDLSPNNLLVTATGQVHLVDLELARPLDASGPDVASQSGTPGYTAPEQFRGAAPDPSADLYSLGALILYCFTGSDPVQAPVVVGGPVLPPEASWLEHPLRRGAVPPAVAQVALALLNADPAARPDLTLVDAVLAEVTHGPIVVGSHSRAQSRPERVASATLEQLQPLPTAQADEAITTLVDRLLADLDLHGPRIAPASSFGEGTAPTNVQHGAAGILGVLLQAARLLPDDRLPAVTADVAAWLNRMLVANPAWGVTQGPIGLHFGLAGSCWALAEAGAELGRPALTEVATERLLMAPRDWPGPDVTHGLAGLGLALLRIVELTDDPRAGRAAIEVVDRLEATGVRDAAGLTWYTPPTAASTFAGKRFHGFAHGTAGVATFLLAAGRLLADERAEALAHEAGAALARAGIPRYGYQQWGQSPEDPATPLPHWCNGASGVVTLLARLDPLRVRDLDPDLDLTHVVREAGRGSAIGKWVSSAAYCHGLSGNADALHDLVALGLDPRARERAADLLALMWSQRVRDEGGEAVGEDPQRIVPDFGVGYGGALSALLRHRHGGGRIWLPEVIACPAPGL